MKINKFRIIGILCFITVFSFLIAALIIWPQELTYEISDVERITNLLPFTSMAIGVAGYYLLSIVAKKYKSLNLNKISKTSI